MIVSRQRSPSTTPRLGTIELHVCVDLQKFVPLASHTVALDYVAVPQRHHREKSRSPHLIGTTGEPDTATVLLKRHMPK